MKKIKIKNRRKEWAKLKSQFNVRQIQKCKKKKKEEQRKRVNEAKKKRGSSESGEKR